MSSSLLLLITSMLLLLLLLMLSTLLKIGGKKASAEKKGELERNKGGGKVKIGLQSSSSSLLGFAEKKTIIVLCKVGLKETRAR